MGLWAGDWGGIRAGFRVGVWVGFIGVWPVYWGACHGVWYCVWSGILVGVWVRKCPIIHLVGGWSSWTQPMAFLAFWKVTNKISLVLPAIGFFIAWRN